MLFPSFSSRIRGASHGQVAWCLVLERRTANDWVLRAGREGLLGLDALSIALISYWELLHIV